MASSNGKSVALGPLKDPLLLAYRELRQMHREFDRAARALEQGIGRPACIPNCGACCMYNTPTWTTLEAIHAISVLTGTHQLSGALSRAEGWLLDRKVHQRELKLFAGIPFGWASPELHDEWCSVITGGCPFLTEDKNCSIWQVRPLACRAYGVTRHTVNWETRTDDCPRPLGNGESAERKMVVDGSPIRQMYESAKARWKLVNPGWVVIGLAPTLLHRVARPDVFKKQAQDGHFASAKLIGTNIDTSIMWQPQVESLSRGAFPDLVAHGITI